MAKIVIIEDEQDIRDLVIYTLEASGWKGYGFASYHSFIEAKLEAVDLFILDIMLPQDDGLTIIKHLKNHPDYRDLPIIMLTAKGSELDKVKALNLGADDYVVKPFGVLELVARINARLRHKEKQHQLKFK
ncbi:MAG TPA: response regulator, partial [Erysipelothrix sp.]|nr:response regulator [Erysipelothrix sp.]